MTKRYFPPPNWPPAPPGWTPPPGWQPDPKWGPPPANWALWREDQSWFSRHKVMTGVGGGLAFLVLVSAIGNSGGSTTESASVVNSATPAPSAPSVTSSGSPSSPSAPASQPTPSSSSTTKTPEPPQATTQPDSSEHGEYPSGEKQFVAVVAKAQEDASEAKNDLQYGAALSRRNKSLCKIIGSGKVQGWVGNISRLDSNGDGYGVLAIEIADGAAVGTWNNALSDFEDDTLIKPGDLLDKLSTFEEGQQVEFSGRFIRQSGTCINDKRLTKVGKLDDPEFVFKFSSVK